MTHVLASTTSHKREPLLPTLEVFGRLGLREVDVNLHHILEVATPVEAIVDAVARHGLTVRCVSGGWCDFFDDAPRIEATFQSVSRQVDVAHRLNTSKLRLFFGRLKYEQYTDAARTTVCANLQRLSEAHTAMTFVFENHDGASLHPEVCAEILQRVDRPNIRMNFDPINFERHDVKALPALEQVLPFVGHVHLKGLFKGEFCEFGDGDVDLTPVLRRLVDSGYAGDFSVEDEGHYDGTLRLYQSVRRAQVALQRLLPGFTAVEPRTG